jgi:hypothetical protein
MAFLIPMVAGVAISFTANKVYEYFNRSPPNPPPPPSPEVTRQIMIRNAQDKLGMDIVNHYNIGICGGSGAGLFIYFKIHS